MQKTTAIIFMLLFGSLFFPTQTRAEHLSYAHIADRLTNREKLAQLPTRGETTLQASSYNRASSYNLQTNQYINWFAHADGTGYIRKETEGYVLAEIDGPGCIWRIWTAHPDTGRVIIILDGQRILDMPFQDYFNGQHSPFNLPNLTYQSGSGYNCYIPISYQKSCKIIARENWGLYYNIGYTKFAPGTSVETFAPNNPMQQQILTTTNQKLTQHFSHTPQTTTHTQHITLLPNQSHTFQLKGPQAIAGIKAYFLSPQTPHILRNLTLSITWDHNPEPSVWLPLGDFFGTTFITRPYQSFIQGTQNDTAYASWYMPFEKNAEIKIANDHTTPISFTLHINQAPLTAPITQYTRFHAKWHRDLPITMRPDREKDWPILITPGPGRYCGMILNVWNPLGGWWGEGDEKFFVDGESFPSTFGTGTEDYFGYAWADPTLFHRPFHGQISNDGLNRDHITLYRWQIADNIPFQQNFEGYIEKYLPNNRPTTYDCTTFWYAQLQPTQPYVPLNLNDRTAHWEMPPKPFLDGYLEGEHTRIAAKTGGNCLIEETETTGLQWHQNAQLWWVGATIGDTLSLEIPIEKTGNYTLQLGLTQAPDYGTFQIALDQKILVDQLDLYHPTAKQAAPQTLGTHNLKQGIHHLKITITGAHHKAIKRYRFGLDYIHIENNIPK